MAKKKASAKKPLLKKVAKKSSAKKPVKKAAPAKTKAAKKTSVKKVAAPKKAVSKKTVKKAAKAPAKKTASAKTKTPSSTPAMKMNLKPAKKLDLSDFVTPLDDRLFVQISGAEKMTAGGLYIPDTVSDVSGNLQGTVVAVGRGHISKKGHLRPMDVRVGDKVVFSEHSGSKVKIENEDLVILREVDVMGIVSK